VEKKFQLKNIDFLEILNHVMAAGIVLEMDKHFFVYNKGSIPEHFDFSL